MAKNSYNVYFFVFGPDQSKLTIGLSFPFLTFFTPHEFVSLNLVLLFFLKLGVIHNIYHLNL